MESPRVDATQAQLQVATESAEDAIDTYIGRLTLLINKFEHQANLEALPVLQLATLLWLKGERFTAGTDRAQLHRRNDDAASLAAVKLLYDVRLTTIRQVQERAQRDELVDPQWVTALVTQELARPRV